SPWVQRLRQIHQLQTAWLVYPTAEHSRFQHVLGAMHLASRVWQRLSSSFFRVFSEHPEWLGGHRLPSSAYIESLLRIAALLHDVGHGPFGHFFDSHYLSKFTASDGAPLTHESLGAEIIRTQFKDIIAGIRRNPSGLLDGDETLDCEQVAYLIVRPHENEPGDRNRPAWLKMLRGLFCGLYTVDNMDFVLRDAYMSGYSRQAFDIDRLIHYSFFSEQGLTL
ncbi:MAG: HD domain-containing protein, partial [Planctomycetia bacterium]|nr:HD domain-containing protein [Planctomycetia bacterium]